MSIGPFHLPRVITSLIKSNSNDETSICLILFKDNDILSSCFAYCSHHVGGAS